MSGSFFGSQRSRSQGSRLSHKHRLQFGDDTADDATEGNRTPLDESVQGSPRVPSPSAGAMSSSGPQKQPPRSYFHHSHYGSPGNADTAQYSSQGVREQTAELAAFALSEVRPYVSSPPRHEAPLLPHGATGFGSENAEISNLQEIIREESEPSSPETPPGASSKPHRTSTLTKLLRNSPPNGEIECARKVYRDEVRRGRTSNVNGDRRVSPPADEQTALLYKGTVAHTEQTHRISNRDLESQGPLLDGSWPKAHKALAWPKDKGMAAVRRAINPKSWDRKAIWRKGIMEPVSYVPSVILGLLLNILDALSYGE
ncbi:hypothetical protein FGG08_000901 [Glutinoglossum americanum]|uniref:Uncharacterized protein n=1 Tax=Glutinoglossum americanum TaxID=1670608 RepID=A0A9P8IC22_9PEZI|nr:hypothetical protein FGG08_000901 [Glutinoglossum americanum]